MLEIIMMTAQLLNTPGGILLMLLGFFLLLRGRV